MGSGHGQHVDIKYYPHGDLAAYIQHNSITSELQSNIFKYKVYGKQAAAIWTVPWIGHILFG